jgi:c-di-GMP-binding flagellar brake protein YcgR
MARLKAVPSSPATDLNLQVGETLQVQFMDDETRGQFFVKVVGFLPERSVIVTTPEKGGQPMSVRDGRAVLARSFSGEHARGFTCVVLASATQPYAHLHLSYPTKVETMLERQSSRVRSALAVGVRTPDMAEDARDIPAVIRDLSITGAQLLASASVGESGGRVVIKARLPIARIGDQPVDLPALVRNAVEETEVRDSLWRFRCGVEFDALDAHTTLVLRAYLYERFAPEN